MTEFVARQPIFNQKEQVYGYELLFRSSLEDFFDGSDGDAASRIVADHLLTLGRCLTEGRIAFINCTTQFLLRDFVRLLPPASTAVEILETVVPDEAVLQACRRLKDSGYLIALDDFVLTPESWPLAEMADIIKVDFLGTAPADRKTLIEEFAPRGVRMLAEKLEGRADFENATELGYEYFQGHFFCRPKIIAGRRIPASKVNYLQIIEAVAGPRFEPAEIEKLITREVSLCYKLLNYVNSALFGFRTEIRSIRHALTLLGRDEVRKLVSMLAAVVMGADKPPELITTALVRAKCCELVAARAGARIFDSTPFLVGMFSVIDALLGRPMEEILAQLALPPDAKGALLGEKNQLRDIYELVFAYEKGNWGPVNWYAGRLQLDETVMPIVYFDALDWANLVFEVASAA